MQPLKFVTLFVACFVLILIIREADGQNPTFAITTVGTFKQNDQYGLGICQYCNCVASCKWVDNFVCATRASAGADDNQQRWGSCGLQAGCPCFNQSGVGFQGVQDLQVTANAASGSKVGILTHYNNPIRGDSPTSLRLAMQISSSAFPKPVIVTAPLTFLETDNTNTLAGCDPSIQQSKTPCDDRFSFDEINTKSTFVVNNTLYELAVNGFVASGTTGTPIKAFVTEEGKTNTADIYVTINATCADSSCGPNETPRGLPYCDCQCNLDAATCQQLFGPNWGLSPTGASCQCECLANPKTCPPGETLNLDTCTCGCNVTDASCKAINANYEASTESCGCSCPKQAQIDCYNSQPFYRTNFNDSCACECAITDKMCQDHYNNNNYVADASTCGCNPKSTGDGDGSPDPGTGGWVGIIIAILICIIGFFAAVFGVLCLLIKCGVIPGVYGHYSAV